MTQLKDPAVEILKKIKVEKLDVDKEANEAVKVEVKDARLKAWKRPKDKKGRDDGRAERQADWEARK